MARGDVRIAITLACEECRRRNYQTNKSKRNDPEPSSQRVSLCAVWQRHHRQYLRSSIRSGSLRLLLLV